MCGLKSFNNRGRHLFLLVFILTYFFLVESCSFAKDIKYSVTERPDGGYTLYISYSKRHWIPITAEGMFPLDKGNYTIDVIGKGKEYTSGRGLKGYLYTQEDIKSLSTLWNFGYAWIDADRMYLYLNLYWMILPDESAPSKINGKYKLKN
jgi:hypothetical protein